MSTRPQAVSNADAFSFPHVETGRACSTLCIVGMRRLDVLEAGDKDAVPASFRSWVWGCVAWRAVTNQSVVPWMIPYTCRSTFVFFPPSNVCQ